MDTKELTEILKQYKAGDIREEDVLLKLREAPFEDLGYAKLDTHRALRQGAAEVIYGAGKTPAQIAGIAAAARNAGQKTVLITRMSQEAASYYEHVWEVNSSRKTSEKTKGSQALQHQPGNKSQQESWLSHDDPSCQTSAASSDDTSSQRPFFSPDDKLQYDPISHIGIIGTIPEPDGKGTIAVVTGGTSDMPVAEEAARTAEVYGNRVVRIYDVGVAGIHRLFSHLDELMRARVVICIAGMEGALTSVVGGLVNVPVIAVPTSVGYGASFHGLSALLSMLNSCASGVSVVNIDNGFGAAYQASMINHL